MKKKTFFLSFVILTLCTNIISAQDCNIGNEDTTGYDNLSLPFWANYLLGSSFSLNSAGTLQSINLISQTAGAQVQMAVYDDNSGAPGTLISASSVGVVSQGITTLSVTPLLLSPGNYWIMAVYAADEYGICNNSTGMNLIYYTTLPFGNPLPSSAASFINYTGADLAYFLIIDCLTTGEENISEDKNIRIYPNPSSGYIYINASGSEKQFSIADMYGRLVEQGTVQNNNQPVSAERLSPGIYTLEIVEGGKKIYSGKVVVY